jgi:hypothetical protein
MRFLRINGHCTAKSILYATENTGDSQTAGLGRRQNIAHIFKSTDVLIKGAFVAGLFAPFSLYGVQARCRSDSHRLVEEKEKSSADQESTQATEQSKEDRSAKAAECARHAHSGRETTIRKIRCPGSSYKLADFCHRFLNTRFMQPNSFGENMSRQSRSGRAKRTVCSRSGGLHELLRGGTLAGNPLGSSHYPLRRAKMLNYSLSADSFNTALRLAATLQTG